MAAVKDRAPIHVLKTKQLVLRPFRRTDLPHVQRYAVRPEFYRYLPIPVQTSATVAVFLEKLIDAQSDADGNLTFAIEPRGIGHVVGAIRIAVRDATNRQGDVGFGLDAEFQRLGYMTEALKRVLRFGFEDLDLHRIWATADVKNQKSWELMERVGMIREGLLRQDKLIRGQWRDSYFYAILEDEFLADGSTSG